MHSLYAVHGTLLCCVTYGKFSIHLELFISSKVTGIFFKVEDSNDGRRVFHLVHRKR